MFLTNFITKIGHFFAGLFSSIEAAWDKFEPEEQSAVEQASGVVDIINQNVGKTPAVVFQLIQLKYPGITQQGVQDAITTVAKGLNVEEQIVSPDFETTILNVQNYLASFTGNAFITTVKSFVALLAVAFNPSITVIQKVELVLEWVYQKLIKGNSPTELPAS